MNSYGIIGNNILNLLDFWGLWQATAESAGQERRIYIKEDNDTPEKLAKIVELEFSEFDKWAISIVDEDGLCTYSVPNTWISADLLRGGTWDNDLISRCIIHIRS